jgi:hypothetical protein
MSRDDDPQPELPEAEAARVRHRDRKRTTPMVVDNAGVRRVLPAIRERRLRRAPKKDGSQGERS